MKNRKYVLITAATLAVAAWATPIFAQEDTAIRSIVRPGSRLLDRAIENIDRLPEDLQGDVTDLKEGIDAIKDAWTNEYRPGQDATLDEIKAARAAFQEAYADDIASNKELRKEVVRELRDGLRDRRGDDQPWNEEARELNAEYKELKRQLAADWKAVVAGLGGDATREDLRNAKERFLEANADVIAKQKELAQQIRDLIRENKGERRPVVDREPLPPELQAMRDEIRLARRDLKALRRDARLELRDIDDPAEREVKRAEILEELKEAHNDIKDKRRELIEDLRDEQDGDRRAED